MYPLTSQTAHAPAVISWMHLVRYGGTYYMYDESLSLPIRELTAINDIVNIVNHAGAYAAPPLRLSLIHI